MSKSVSRSYRERTPKRHLKPLHEPKFWLWVTKPERYEYLDQPGISWTCDKDTHEGDLILLYRAKKQKDIAYLLKADSVAKDWKEEPDKPKSWKFYCYCHVEHKFDNTLSITDMRSDPKLKDWWVLRRNFQGIAFSVEPKYWRLLIEKLNEKNPNSPCDLEVATQEKHSTTACESTKTQATQNMGGGFGDSESNKQVEKRAIEFVTKHYSDKHWKVVSVEQDKCGYDLKCTKAKKELHVEVKGLSGEFGPFNITANEVEKAKNDPIFELCIVACANSSNPKLHTYAGREFLGTFELRAIQFRAAPHTP